MNPFWLLPGANLEVPEDSKYPCRCAVVPAVAPYPDKKNAWSLSQTPNGFQTAFPSLFEAHGSYGALAILLSLECLRLRAH